MIYTFYLKHQKYPICAPIFHPLSETESYYFYCKIHVVFQNQKKIYFKMFVIPLQPPDSENSFAQNSNIQNDFSRKLGGIFAFTKNIKILNMANVFEI